MKTVTMDIYNQQKIYTGLLLDVGSSINLQHENNNT